MNIPLSKRLQACCSFICPGARVADIGCDHGYLGIHLLYTGIASSVIASDVNEGPLQCAVANAGKYGVRSKMEFYLSDGVRTLPRDFDTMVCAGMGADTMVSILSSAPWLKSSRYKLVLQCQSKTPMLRKYLSDSGWHIRRETALRDGRFLYTVMEVIWDPTQPKLTVGQHHVSPALLEDPTGEAWEYYRYILQGLQLAAAHRKDPELLEALTELEAMEEVQ